MTDETFSSRHKQSAPTVSEREALEVLLLIVRQTERGENLDTDLLER